MQEEIYSKERDTNDFQIFLLTLIIPEDLIPIMA